MKLRRFSVSVALVACLAGLTWTSTGQGQEQAPTVRYDGDVVIRARIDTEGQLQTLMRLSPDIWSHEVGTGGFIDARIPAETLAALQASRLDYEVLIGDVQKAIDVSMQPARGGIAADPFFNAYRRLDDITAYMNTLRALRPDLVTIEQAGLSLQNRPINVMRLTSSTGGANKPGVFLNGCQHAREWITPAAVMYIADTLVRGYGTDARVTALLDSRVFYLVAVSNPDGYNYSWTTDRLWRKNRRGNYGVDLNRNWGFGWGGPGSSDNQNTEIYRGTAPFSEPESAALAGYVRAHLNIDRHVDIHSYSQLVLYPWGWTRDLCPDDETFGPLGEDIAGAMGAPYGMFYRPGPVFTNIYPASGVASDWTYGERGAFGFGFELRDTGQYGFLLPADQIVPASQEAMEGVFALAEADLRPALRLFVPALTRGQQATFSVIQAAPSAPVSFFYSLDNDGGGSTFVADLNVTLDIRDAVRFAVATARADGTASVTRTIPASAGFRAVWFQAAEAGRTSLVTLTQVN